MNCTAVGKNKQVCKNKAKYGQYCYWHQKDTVVNAVKTVKTAKADKTTKVKVDNDKIKVLEKNNTDLTNEIVMLKNDLNKLKIIYSGSLNERIKLEYYVNAAKYSCPICLDEDVSPSDIIIGYCTHTICNKCYNNANNKTSNTCSLCREPFYQIEINNA